MVQVMLDTTNQRERLKRQIEMLSQIIRDDLAALHRPSATELKKDLLRRAVAQRSANLGELKLRRAVLE